MTVASRKFAGPKRTEMAAKSGFGSLSRTARGDSARSRTGTQGRLGPSARCRARRMAGVSTPTFPCATGPGWSRAPGAMPPRRPLARAGAWRWTTMRTVVARIRPAIRCARPMGVLVKSHSGRAARSAMPSLPLSVPRGHAVPSCPSPRRSIRFAARIMLSSNGPDALRGAPSPRTARPIAFDGQVARDLRVSAD